MLDADIASFSQQILNPSNSIVILKTKSLTVKKVTFERFTAPALAVRQVFLCKRLN